MKGTLYITGKKEPVAVLDEVQVVTMNDNHAQFPHRVNFKAKQLNSSKIMIEFQRDQKMRLHLDDGREANVLLQHTSLDTKGYAVGVLRVLGDL
ncbi:MAG: hypothetical protein KDE19_18890 [Caldilineaceae bacterium]|nr:hypothetical protein [Caldilineaceae bacterium]